MSDATREAAGRVRKVELGDRRLHWLKNVTDPVGAVVASEASCPFGTRWMRRIKPDPFSPSARSPEVRAA